MPHPTAHAPFPAYVPGPSIAVPVGAVPATTTTAGGPTVDDVRKWSPARVSSWASGRVGLSDEAADLFAAFGVNGARLLAITVGELLGMGMGLDDAETVVQQVEAGRFGGRRPSGATTARPVAVPQFSALNLPLVGHRDGYAHPHDILSTNAVVPLPPASFQHGASFRVPVYAPAPAPYPGYGLPPSAPPPAQVYAPIPAPAPAPALCDLDVEGTCAWLRDAARGKEEDVVKFRSRGVTGGFLLRCEAGELLDLFAVLTKPCMVNLKSKLAPMRLEYK